MHAPAQRGVAQLFVLLLLVVGVFVGVQLVGKSQELREKAAGENLVVFTDASGNPLPDRISDSNVYLLIRLPENWQLSSSGRSLAHNLFVKSVFAQGSCPGDPQNHDNQYLIDNCDLGQLALLSNERLITFPSHIITQLSNTRLQQFSNDDLVKIGNATGDLPGFLNRFSNDRLLNPQFPNHILSQLPASRINAFPCHIQQ